MSFRDFNGYSSNKIKRYVNGKSFRDMYSPNIKKETVQKEILPPEEPVPQTIISQPVNQYIQRPVSQPIINHQQSLHYSNSVHIQTSVKNMNVPQSIPIHHVQNQFSNHIPQNHYASIPQPTNIPEPPKIPEKKDPSKFVEEYVPTPPPKMVKAKVHDVYRKEEHFDNNIGSFGGTFDGNPDQTTPIADIPVMCNVDDYKI